MATNLTKMGRNCDSEREKISYCVQTRPGGSKLPHERVEHDLIWGGGGVADFSITESQRASFRMEHASIFILGWK